MGRPQQQQQQQAETPTQTQTPIQTQTQTQTTQLIPPTKANGLPLAVLVARVITLVTLIASLIIITTNTATVRGLFRNVTIRFKDIYAYRYMVSCIVIGLVYTCLQVPFAIHHVTVGKRTHNALPMFDFISDTVILSLLATGVGAAFAATLDLKKNLDDLDNYIESTGSASLSQIRSKLDHFFNMAYVSAGFLLIAFLSSGGSSIMSTLSLVKR